MANKIEMALQVCADWGLIPTSFRQCMTWEEQVLWLYKFITEQIVPTTNQLADDFEALKTWVENYLDSQDFEKMVSDKLDEMASDGTLADLINQEIFGELNDRLDDAEKDLATITTINTSFAQKIISNTPQTVVFAGDSLVYGQDPATHARSANPFPELIQSYLRAWYDNVGIITCHNYGVGGAQSAAAIANFNTYLALNPTTIFWSYGTNDITNNVSVNQVITNLDTFYRKCIENSIELIVIIPPMNYYTAARQMGMKVLHDAMLAYCKARSIAYVDMYEYVNNLYNTLAYTIHELQADQTHFSDYTCFRDAIITKLLPIAYVQGNLKTSYVEIGRDRQYVKTNLTSTNVATDIDPLGDGFVISSDEGNEFRINFLLNKSSFVSFVGYSRANAGSAVFTLDGVDYTMDESTGSAATTTQNNFTKEFPVLLEAGLHRITLKSVTFTGEQNRFYIYGFTITESNQNLAKKGYRQIEEEHQLWTGSSSGTTGSFLLDVKKFNKLILMIGSASSLQTVVLTPFHMWTKFADDTTYTIPTAYNGTAGIATFAVDATNNGFTYSTTQTAPLRAIYGVYSNEVFDEPIISAPIA